MFDNYCLLKPNLRVFKCIFDYTKMLIFQESRNESLIIQIQMAFPSVHAIVLQDLNNLKELFWLD